MKLIPFMYLVGYDENFKKVCNTGWGCGYVAIPINHKEAINHFTRINKEEAESPEIGYHYVNKYYDGYSEQEITYTENVIINDNDYLVIGFDTAHSYNSSNDNYEYCFKETAKLLDYINSIS